MTLDASNYQACLDRIAAAGKIGSKIALQILEEVADRADRMRQTGKSDPFVTAAHDMAQQAIEAAKYDRLDALRNAAKRTAVLDRIESQGGIGKAAEVIRSLLHWVPGAKSLDSIEGQWHSLSRAWQSTVGNRLRQAGLEKVAISGQLDHEIADEIWGRNTLGPEAIRPSGPARKIADALKPALDLAKERLNAAGARIGSTVDYVTHTNWNPRQLRLAAGKGATADEAFEAWWKADGPRMADKTFEHLVPEEGETMEQAKRRFARSVFDATASGVHMQNPGLSGMADDGNGYIPPAWEGTHNIGRSLSQSRTIFWKDAHAWVDHMREFGGGDSLYAQVMRTLDTSARRTALMEKLGTNPAGNLNTIIRRIEETYRGDLDGLKKFQEAIRPSITHAGVEHVMGRLDGTLNIPTNADWAQRVEHLMTLEATSHLGGVSVTHLAAAPATVSAELAHHGMSRLASLGKILKAITTGRGSADAQEVLADAGAFAHGYNLDIATKWKADMGVPGFVSWAAANFMKMTGLGHFLDALQAKGVKSVLMAKLGRQADRDFAALDHHQSALLQRYGVGPGEWDLLRSSPDPLHVEGQRYITPRDAAAGDPAKVEALLRARGAIGKDAVPEVVARAVQKFQWELGDKYLMYLNDAAEHATVTPGVKERAALYRGSRPGDLHWMLARFVGQFKLWPMAAVSQIIGREIGYSLSGKEMAQNIGWLLALSTAGGALRMSVNDVAMGRPQRDYTHPMTLLAALAQGGGLGIYGDFLFGESNRMGAGLVPTTMGPVASDADRLFQIYNRFRQDLDKGNWDKALKHMWPDLARFGVQHIPFANLVYLKASLDYLLWFHLFEASSPGWWERTNRRLLKEQGRTMSGYTPGAGVPWTPYGLGTAR